MNTINIIIQNKIACLLDMNSFIVCGNKNYTINFSFDEEWDEYEAKTARFKWGGKCVDVVFTGNQCPAPVILDTKAVKVGVYAGDLYTTTSANIRCISSIRCGKDAPVAPTPEVYDQIMQMINDGMLKGEDGKDGADLYLGETSGTAYSGDKGKELSDRVTESEKNIAFLYAIAEQGGAFTKTTVSDAFNTRVTAGGLNIVDGSTAVLKKVVGSTVKCENLFNGDFYNGLWSASTGERFTSTQYKCNREKISVIENTTYTFSYKPTGTEYIQSVVYFDKNGSFIKNSSGALASFTITTPADCAFISFNMLVADSSGNALIKGDVGTLMINAGSTAKPYQPYFTGLKNASFAGIESGGRNLFNINGNILVGKRVATASGGTYTDTNYSVSDYTVVKGLSAVCVSGTQPINGQYYYALYDVNKKFISGGGYADGRYIPIPENAYYLKFDFLSTATEVIANAGTTPLPFTPYIEPNVFNFPETELGEWDSIDLENQKVVEGTKIVVFDGTENWSLQSVNSHGIYNYQVGVEKAVRPEQSMCNLYDFDGALIANATKEGYLLNETSVFFIRSKSYTTVEAWKAHLAELYASGNPLMVAYELKTPTETPFTAQQSASGNEYTAKKGGTEKVLGNDNAEFGAENTVEQVYYTITEG